MPPDWDEIQNLFAEALEQAPHDRASYVSGSGRTDEIIREVLSLLESSEDANDYFDGLIDRTHGREPDSWRGQVIGAWELVGRLGTGGMGTVYRARRQRPFVQEGALKLLQLNLPDSNARQRFLAEQQILAQLTHPNIASIIDGGVTDQGAPYFVMEVVEGEPITAYCDQQELSIRARIEAFLKACDGLRYAHRQLVVHRDIKPANVLVGANGEVKIVDFGIAKMLDESQGNADLTGSFRPLTLAYASPEQLRGEPTSTSFDVYALGLLLHELLTGSLPYHLTAESPVEQRSGLVQPPLDRLSTSAESESLQEVARQRRTTPGRLIRELESDLQWIAARATTADAEERYESVDALQADLQRWLDGEPVLARKPSRRYQLQKWLARHPWEAAAASLAVLATIAIVAISLLFASITRRQATEIARERDTAQQITGFLTDLFESSDPYQSGGETVTARQLLDRGADRLRDDLHDRPAIRAEVLGVIGNVYRSIGLPKPAVELLRESLTLREPDNDQTDGYTKTLVSLGLAETSLGDYPAAGDNLRRALDRQQSENTNVLAKTMVLNALTEVHIATGRFDEAIVTGERSVGLVNQIESRSWRALMAISDAYNNLGVLRYYRQDLDSAARLYQAAIDVIESELPENHPQIANLRNNLGALYVDQARWADAVAMYESVVAAFEKLYAPESTNVVYPTAGLASALLNTGEYQRAQGLVRQTLARLDSAGKTTDLAYIIVRSLDASALIATGEFDAAYGSLLDTMDIARSALPRDHYITARLLLHLANIDYLRIRLETGDARRIEARSMLINTVEPSSRYLIHSDLTEAHAVALRDSDIGDDALRDIQSKLLEKLGPTAFLTQLAQLYLSEHYARTGRLDEASQLRAKSLLRVNRYVD